MVLNFVRSVRKGEGRLWWEGFMEKVSFETGVEESRNDA